MTDLERPKDPAISRKNRQLSLKERSLVHFDFLWKKSVEIKDDSVLVSAQVSGFFASRLILAVSSLLAWSTDVDFSRLRNIPLSLFKMIIALPLAAIIFLIALCLVIVGGTLSGIFGMRNHGEYSTKEQVAIWLPIVGLLLCMPLLVSEYSLYRVSLILTYSLGVIGLDLLFGQCGIISLGQSGFLMFGGYLTIWLTNGIFAPKLPILVAITLAALLNGFVGLLLGLPALRVKDHYLVIVTLAFSIVVPKIFRSPPMIPYSGLKEGGLYLATIEVPSYLGHMPPYIWKYFIIAVPAMFLIIIAYNIIHHSQIGRGFRTLKCDSEISSIIGIPVVRYKLTAFMLSAVYAGFAGGFFVILNEFMSPDSFTTYNSVNYLVATAVGGPASILGSLFGGTFLAFEPEITRWAGEHMQGGKSLAEAFFGLILVLVVLFAPKGIAGELSSRLKARFTGLTRRGAFQMSPPPDYDPLNEKKKYFN